jgi:hypothetical protein
LKGYKMKKTLSLIGIALVIYAVSNVDAVPRAPDNAVRTVTTSTVMTAQLDAMFTVSGGPIEIVSLFGQCTTLIASAPGNMTIVVDADDGTDYDNTFSVAVDIDTLGAGDVVTFTDAISVGAGTFVANQNAGQNLSWFCPEGVITQSNASTGTGAIEWFMSYRRLVPAARVTPN